MTNTLKATAIAFIATTAIASALLRPMQALLWGCLSGAIVLIANLLTED